MGAKTMNILKIHEYNFHLPLGPFHYAKFPKTLKVDPEI